MQLIPTSSMMSNTMLRTYKDTVISYVKRYVNTKSMQVILSEFSMEDIEKAVDSMYLENGIISTPSNSRQDYILRLLQYGGKGVKALNILSLAAVELGGII